MVSYLLRRSGIAVCLMLEIMEWKPKRVYHVGIGQNSQEVDVMLETWGSDGFELHGFEANPLIVQQIQAIYPGKLHATAVGDTVGTTTLYSKRRHKDGSSLYPFGEEFQQVSQFEVPITTLDTVYPDGPGERSLLWVDTEGAELRVLQGAAKFLSGVDVVNIEMTGRPPSCEWSDGVEVDLLLERAGFFRQWVHTSRVSAGQYDALYCRRGVFRPDLCSCPCAVRRYASGN